MPEITNKLKFTLFADDTTVTMYDNDLVLLTDRMNAELKLLNDWCIKNRLTINTDKTEFIVFSNKNKTTDEPELKIGHDPLSITSSYKFLGVSLDNQLKFNEHANSVLSKISKSNGILYKIRKLLTPEARINFYNSFVYPYLAYNIAVWGKTHNNILKPLFLAQKRIVRCIADAEFYAHTTPLFKKLQLLKFEDIYKYVLCIHMFKSLKIGMYKKTHSVNTRTRNEAKTTFHCLSMCQQAVSFNGPNEWNALPPSVKEIKTIGAFKRKLKSHFLSKYDA